jgi:hypothetical protein
MRYGWEIVQHERDLPGNRVLSRSLLLDAAFQPVETGSEELRCRVCQVIYAPPVPPSSPQRRGGYPPGHQGSLRSAPLRC